MISDLLTDIIFGSSFSSPHIQENIVYRSKNITYIYFNSHRSINTLMNINSLSSTNFKRKKLQYLCCGKVNLKKIIRISLDMF